MLIAKNVLESHLDLELYNSLHFLYHFLKYEMHLVLYVIKNMYNRYLDLIAKSYLIWT